MEKYSSFALSCIGENHLRKGIVCQDSKLAIDNPKYVFAASADGHGSPCYLRTDRGSEYAVDCALECVDEFLRNLKDVEVDLDDQEQRDQLFGQLWRSIVSRWHNMTEEDYRFEPFTQEELDGIPEQYDYYRERYLSGKYIDAYGTTLAFAVVTDDFAFCGQIGDGSCVVLDDNGDAMEPIPEDPRCHDNITTSLCQDDAAYSARFCYFSKGSVPSAIFLGTDGIENSYWSRDQLYGFYRGLALTFSENGMEEGKRQLSEFLPEMTRRGSGDDVTCAGILNLEELKLLEEALAGSLVPSSSEIQPAEANTDENVIVTDETDSQPKTEAESITE